MNVAPRRSSEEQKKVPPLGPTETARYTYELVVSLSRIAERQGQPLLAHLLEIAALEAKTQAEAPPRTKG